jgi:hypothetical protein
MTFAIRHYAARTISGQSIGDGVTIARVSLPREPWLEPAAVTRKKRETQKSDTTQHRTAKESLI